MRAHPACQVDAPNSSASLAARRGKLAGILHGRPVTEKTTGKTCHGKHARVEQALECIMTEWMFKVHHDWVEG